MDRHRNETAAREAKVRKIADCPVLTLGPLEYRLAADQVDAGHPEGLYAARTIGELAGVTRPSSTTLRLVAARLEDRARQVDADPFADLPRIG